METSTTMSHIQSKLTREQAIALVSDLSGGHSDSVRLVTQAFDRSIPQDHERSDWNTDENALRTIVAGCVSYSGRSTFIDWACPIKNAAEEFAALLQSVGIDPDTARAQIARGPSISRRGWGVGIAFVPFRQSAEDAGMRFINLYEGTNSYCMAIVTQEVAEKWVWVRLDDIGYIGDADRQFGAALFGAGITPREAPNRAKDPPDVATLELGHDTTC
jgi:hypothetical protein